MLSLSYAISTGNRHENDDRAGATAQAAQALWPDHYLFLCRFFRACAMRCGHVDKIASSVPVEWPIRSVCRSLGRLRGHLRTFSSLQASKVAAREWRLLNFLEILERVNWGGANMRVSCVEVFFWQLVLTVSLATETTGGGDSSSIFGPKMTSEAISECLILKIFMGEHAPRPP